MRITAAASRSHRFFGPRRLPSPKLEPRGAQKGPAFTLTVLGTGLCEGANDSFDSSGDLHSARSGEAGHGESIRHLPGGTDG